VLPADKLVGSSMILLPSRERVNTQNGDRPPGLEGGLGGGEEYGYSCGFEISL